MKRELLLTADGSHTISLLGTKTTYHSVHGAIQESQHVYINAGVKPFLGKYQPLKILEIGFGTGLNALLAYKQALHNNRHIEYTAIELFPLEEREYTALNYCELTQEDNLQDYFLAMHTNPWGKLLNIHPLFSLHKINASVLDTGFSSTFHCIFFDAFAPNDQPELWTKEIFEKMFAVLENRGILVTYCCKGSVRRILTATGFIVEKLPGPPGKKEIIRATKLID